MTILATHIRFGKILCCVALGSVPTWCAGAVTINEIAWMGTSVSADDEWIELYNDGEAVSLDGWELSDSAGLSVALSGTIAAGQYGVLERTDESSAPGKAFLLYTGALTNTGSTLTLYDASGAIVDQVAGGESWSTIGGDNSTKETAQLTSAGWVTGTPSPGAVNQVGSSPSVDDTSGEETTTTSVLLRKETEEPAASLQTGARALQVRFEGSTTLQVGDEVEFGAEASGLGEAVLSSLEYTWNFGDGSTAEGREVTHRYYHPGTYVVTTSAYYKGYDAELRTTVTVLPVALSLSELRDGSVQVHSNARYEQDISGYRLGGHDETFVFPAGSVIAPQGTVTVSEEKFGHKFMPLLRDPYGTVVAALESSSPAQSTAPQPTARSQAAPVAPLRTSEASADFTFASDQPTNTKTEDVVSEKQAEAVHEATSTVLTEAEALAALAPSAPAERTTKWPLFALVGVSSVLLLAVYTRQV